MVASRGFVTRSMSTATKSGINMTPGKKMAVKVTARFIPVRNTGSARTLTKFCNPMNLAGVWARYW